MTYSSYALYRCGASDTAPTALYSTTDGSQIGSLLIDSSISNSGNVFRDSGGNVYFTVYKGTYNSTTHDMNYTSYALYRSGTTTALKSVTDAQLVVPSSLSETDFYFRSVKSKEEGDQTSSYSYVLYHYDGTDVSEIHTFNEEVSGWGYARDRKHKTLYLYETPMSSDLGSTLWVFDNTDAHNPELSETFELDGRIRGGTLLYNNVASTTADDATRPTPEELIPDMTDEEKTEAKNTAVDALRSGGNEEAAKAFEDAELATDSEMESAITQATETERQTLTSNATSEMAKQGRTVRGGTVAVGTVRFAATRLVFLSITLPESMQTGDLLTFFKNAVTSSNSMLLAADDSDAAVFLNSDGEETKVVPADHQVTVVTVFEGGKTYQPMVVASTPSNSVSSNKSSGGCDAGFGTLALALAASVLLKKRGK